MSRGITHRALLLLLAITSSTHAETHLWAALATEDLAAARALIADNHPAALLSKKDPEFAIALDNGYTEATALAKKVRTYGGYRAVLTRFAAGFGDRHIRSDALLTGAQRCPGFLVSLHQQWLVTVRVADDAPPLHSRLIECDGRSADQLAEARLRAVTSNWDIRAQRLRMSSRLLVDDSDPFVPHPGTCTFELQSGQRVRHALKWTQVAADALAGHLKQAAGRPEQKAGLSQVEDGWWIRLGTLTDDARPVVEEVARKADVLAKSRLVVLDLRGNGGGSSVYGERIAIALFGSKRVTHAKRKTGQDADVTTWRVSEGNLATLRQYVERFSRELGAEDSLVADLREAQTNMERAMREKQPFSTSTFGQPPTGEQETPSSPPQVVLITDRFCFSSCLLVTDLFRSLGALHVGEETDQNTHYTEVRSITLPSGLSTFSTMQAYNSSPLRIGPFTPSITFDGNFNDDEAVKAWVLHTVESQQSR